MEWTLVVIEYQWTPNEGKKNQARKGTSQEPITNSGTRKWRSTCWQFSTFSGLQTASFLVMFFFCSVNYASAASLMSWSLIRRLRNGISRSLLCRQSAFIHQWTFSISQINTGYSTLCLSAFCAQSSFLKFSISNRNLEKLCRYRDYVIFKRNYLSYFRTKWYELFFLPKLMN